MTESLQNLKREGANTARQNGHMLGMWTDSSDKRTSTASCRTCGNFVQVTFEPRGAGSSDITGVAYTNTCGGQMVRQEAV